jgi:hypothetical protein
MSPTTLASTTKRRGTCTNAVALQQDIVDGALLAAIAGVLDQRILDRAVDKALARLRTGRESHLGRRTQVERELSLIVTKMDRLMDALAEGTALKDEVIARLNEEKQRKTVLAAELTKLSELAGIESLDETKLKRELHERVADVKALLQQNTTQARQMLRKLLAGSKIEMEGFGEGRERGYKFRGELCIGKLISGAATNTSDWRGPNGIRTRVPMPPHAFASESVSCGVLSQRGSRGDGNTGPHIARERALDYELAAVAISGQNVTSISRYIRLTPEDVRCAARTCRSAHRPEPNDERRMTGSAIHRPERETTRNLTRESRGAGAPITQCELMRRSRANGMYRLVPNACRRETPGPASLGEADLLEVRRQVPIVGVAGDLSVAELHHRRPANLEWLIGGRQTGKVLDLATAPYPLDGSRSAVGGDKPGPGLELEVGERCEHGDREITESAPSLIDGSECDVFVLDVVGEEWQEPVRIAG